MMAAVVVRRIAGGLLHPTAQPDEAVVVGTACIAIFPTRGIPPPCFLLLDPPGDRGRPRLLLLGLGGSDLVDAGAGIERFGRGGIGRPLLGTGRGGGGVIEPPPHVAAGAVGGIGAAPAPSAVGGPWQRPGPRGGPPPGKLFGRSADGAGGGSRPRGQNLRAGPPAIYFAEKTHSRELFTSPVTTWFWAPHTRLRLLLWVRLLTWWAPPRISCHR